MTDEIPRCETCKWWIEAERTMLPADIRRCERCGSKDGEALDPDSLACAYDGESYFACLETHATFGCVQHTPREADDNAALMYGVPPEREGSGS